MKGLYVKLFTSKKLNPGATIHEHEIFIRSAINQDIFAGSLRVG